MCVPYLCGGTFFILLTEAKVKTATRRELQSGKKDRVSNKNMLEGLIQLIISSFKQPIAGRTFEGDTSDYRACKVSFGENLPFDDSIEITEFDKRIKEHYLAVLGDIEHFIEMFLKIDSHERIQWLIQALLTLIKEDSLINDNELFYICETPITKSELLEINHYCLSSFLLEIWHYIVMNRKDNTKGRKTFEAWNKRENQQNGKWKFTSTIGTTYFKSITYNLYNDINSKTNSRKTDESSNAENIEETTDKNQPRIEVYDAPFIKD